MKKIIKKWTLHHHKTIFNIEKYMDEQNHMIILLYYKLLYIILVDMYVDQ